MVVQFSSAPIRAEMSEFEVEAYWQQNVALTERSYCILRGWIETAL